MSIPRREARQLCSLREWALVETSFPPKIEAVPKSRLKTKVTRSRRLRQKYTDLSRRQDLSARGRRTGVPSERLNVRTKRKARLFSETLIRFQARLKKLGRSEVTKTRAKKSVAAKRPRQSSLNVALVQQRVS